MGWPSFPGPGGDNFDEHAVWEDDDEGWAEDTAFDPDQGQAEDDDRVIPPSAPLAQPGAYNLPYPRSREQEERDARRERQWPYADDKPWDPDPDRGEDEARHHTAPWPLPQPPPIAEPEP